MKARKLINLATLATAMIGAGSVNAATNNPLQPDYFWGKTNMDTIASVGTIAIAPTNPLQPAYFAAKGASTTFVATAAATEQAYIDARNPLHPSFKRF